MTLACYSARAGAAFLPTENNQWLRMDADDPDTLQPCSAWEVAVALRGCTDVVEMPADDVEQVHAALFHAVELMNASDLTLWLLDSKLPEETRQLAARELNGFLDEPGLIESWKGIFWWQPLGRDADLVNALRIAASVKAEPVAVQLQELQQRQEAITHVHDQLEGVLASDAVEPGEIAIVRQRVRTVRWHVAVVEVFGKKDVGRGDGFEREVCQLCPVPTNVKEAKWWRSWMARLSGAQDESKSLQIVDARPPQPQCAETIFDRSETEQARSERQDVGFKEYAFDVFLSHSNADRELVRQVAWYLRNQGIRVWFDEWSIEVGEDIFLAMERALRASRTCVVFFSKATVVDSENFQTMLRFIPTMSSGRVITVRLANCLLPAPLCSHQSIDCFLEHGIEGLENYVWNRVLYATRF